MGQGRGATPRSARPRAGVDGIPAPRFLGFLRNPAESQRWAAVTPALAHHGGGRSSAHPTACATFCFWRGKGGACEFEVLAWGRSLSRSRRPRRFAAQLDCHWWRKLGQELNQSFPILRAAPITGSVSRSVGPAGLIRRGGRRGMCGHAAYGFGWIQ